MRKILSTFSVWIFFASSALAANSTVNSLPAATTPLTGGELVYCIQNGADAKCTTASVSNANSQITPLATPYLGNVVTGTGIAVTNSGTNLYSQTRSPVFARDSLSAGVVVGVPCFYATAAASNEEHINATATHKVSLEDIAGNITAVTFGGQATGSCANATNGVLASDAVTLTAPISSGQLLWFKDLYTDTTAGIIYQNNGVSVDNGSSFQFSTTPLTDLSGTAGAFANTQTSYNWQGLSLRPLFIATQTVVRSFCLYGDSRTLGVADYYSGTNVDEGQAARSIGTYAPYINIGLGSDRLAWFISSHAARVQLDQYCSDDIDLFDINDITNGASAATVEANHLTIKGYVNAAHKFSIVTTAPNASLTTISASALNVTATGLIQLTVTTPIGAYTAIDEDINISGSTPSNANGYCKVISNSNTTVNCVNPLAVTTGAATGTITFTDSYANSLNQTTNANNSVTTAVNRWKRANANAYYAVPDISDVVSSGRDSGKWNSGVCGVNLFPTGVPSNPGSLTNDGLHPNHCGYLTIQNSGVLSPRVLN